MVTAYKGTVETADANIDVRHEETLLKRDEATRAISIIALTAAAIKGDAERIRPAGCDGYIAKPIRRREFLSTIAAQLAPR